MRIPRRNASSSIALVALVGANLVPLIGVIQLGWSPFEILVLYWIESGLIGALNVPKILLAGGDPGGDHGTLRINGMPVGSDAAGPILNTFIAGFFIVHYGIFWVVHGVFVLFGLPAFAGADGIAGASLSAIGLVAVSFLASHGVSFAVNYIGDEEYRTSSPGQQMMRPYGRVIVMHVTIVAGGFVVAILGSSVALLALLIVLKTAIDVRAHLNEHAKAKRSGATAPADGSEEPS